MRNEEIIARLNSIKQRARTQNRDQCVTIILTADGFVKMFDASGTVRKPVKSIEFYTNRQETI